MKGVWLQCLDCLQKFIRDKEKKKEKTWLSIPKHFIFISFEPFDLLMSASGPRVTYYTSLHALLAWSITKHEKTCTVADARIYIFFLSLERRKGSKVHFKEQSPLLSPSQTEAQQSLPRTADGTVCRASLEISESSSARKGKTWGCLFQSFSWILPSAHVFWAQMK